MAMVETMVSTGTLPSKRWLGGVLVSVLWFFCRSMWVLGCGVRECMGGVGSNEPVPEIDVVSLQSL